MSTINSIRLTGMASGIDTDEMIKSMLTADQNKIDKAQQKQQTITWQQEIYREIISEAKSITDKYFSITSKDSITNSNAWNTLSINSSNSSMMSAKGKAGSSDVNYNFEITKIAESATIEKSFSSKNSLVGAGNLEITLGGGVTKTIALNEGDTVESMIKAINSEMDGKAKASYSEMTGKFTIKTTETGKNASIKITNSTINQEFKSKDDLVGAGSFNLTVGDEEIKTITLENNDTVETMIEKINYSMEGKAEASYDEITKQFTIKATETGINTPIKITNSTVKTIVNNEIVARGSNMEGVVKVGESIVKNLESQSSNSFTIDNIEYNIFTTGTSNITSKQDSQKVVDNMNAFVEEYNKLMDKVYNLVTQKTNKDYPPLTEAQKEDMSEEEIEKWEKKAKQGLLRNDSELRRFMDNMQTAIFGGKDTMALLNEMGLGSHENYNNKGQISLDKEKFAKALENNSEKVYNAFAGSKTSVFENMKTTMNNYIGGSSSIFAKKAGLEKTASFTNNYYSEQLKNQSDFIKSLQNKFSDKESALYKKFANLESSMNKLNSQMSYFAQS